MRKNTLSGGCVRLADAGLPSTFSEQTDLLNPDDGGVHDGKVDLDVGPGDQGALVLARQRIHVAPLPGWLWTDFLHFLRGGGLGS